jgi:ABC-type multidrug transport system permease subunit
MALFALVKKDFASIIKSKLATFALFIFPLLVVLVLCIGFSVFGFQNIKIVYSKNATLSEEAQKMLNSTLDFLKTKNYVLTEVNFSECIENVKIRQAHICLVVSSPNSNTLKLELYVDETRLNFAYALISQLSQLIQLKEKEISIALIQAIINVVELSEKKAGDSLQKLNELNSKLSAIGAEYANIQSSATAIDTGFSIEDFNVKQLEAIADELEERNLSNATDLIDSLNSAISTLKSKLQATKGRFERIEEKKKVILDASGRIVVLSDEARQLSENVKSQQQEILTAAKGPLRNASVLASPIETEIKPLSVQQKNLDYILPGLISFILMTLTLFFSSILTIKEKKSKAYFRNFLSPVKDSTFILASYISLIIMLVLEMFLIILLISRFSTLISPSFLPNFLPLLLIALTSFIFLGMFVGNLTRDEEVCILVIFFILLAFLFFSPMIMPSEMIKQQAIRNVVAFLPFNLVDNALRDIIFFKFSIVKEYFALCLLLAYAAVFCLAAFLAKKLTKHQLLYT